MLNVNQWLKTYLHTTEEEVHRRNTARQAHAQSYGDAPESATGGRLTDATLAEQQYLARRRTATALFTDLESASEAALPLFASSLSVPLSPPARLSSVSHARRSTSSATSARSTSSTSAGSVPTTPLALNAGRERGTARRNYGATSSSSYTRGEASLERDAEKSPLLSSSVEDSQSSDISSEGKVEEEREDSLYADGDHIVALGDHSSSGLGSFPEYWSDSEEQRAIEYASDDGELSDDPEADIAHEQIVQRLTLNLAASLSPHSSSSSSSSQDTAVPDLQFEHTPPGSPLTEGSSEQRIETTHSKQRNANAVDEKRDAADEEVDVPTFEVASSEDLYQGGGTGGGNDRDTIPFEVTLDESALEQRSAGTRSCADTVRLYGRKLRKRLPHYIPSLYWIPRYPWRDYLAADLVAGLAVGIMVIPQGLAYAGLAGLDPIYGLYTAFVPVIMYAFLGTARQLSMGPDGIVALLVGSAIQPDSATTSEELVNRAVVLAFLVGVMCFVMGLFRVGFINNLLSRPLLVGFVNASAVLIMLEQCDGLWGVRMPKGDNFHKIQSFFEHFTEVHWLSFTMGLSALILLSSMQWAQQKIMPIWKYITLFPVLVVVVLTSILIVWAADLGQPVSEGYSPAEDKVLVLGDINGGFPTPAFPEFWQNFPDLLADLMFPAVMITLIGFFSSVVIGKTLAQVHGYRISANRDLCALGVANLLGSIFLAYPTFGAIPRSAVAHMSGAKTQLHALVAATLVLLTILFLTPLFYNFPSCVVSAIVIVAATQMIEWRSLYFMYKIRAWLELSLCLVMFAISFTFGPQVGIISFLVISVFLVVKHTTMPHVALLGRVGKTRKYRDLAMFSGIAKPLPGLLIFRIDESLYFGNIGQLKDLITKTEQHGSLCTDFDRVTGEPDVIRAIIFDMRNINSMDANALMTWTELVASYKRRGIQVAFVRLGEQFTRRFVRAGIIGNLLSPLHFTKHIYQAVEFVQTGEVLGFSSYSMLSERHATAIKET